MNLKAVNEKTKSAKALTGTSLALLAAGMIGCAQMGEQPPHSSGTAYSTDLIHCYGVNVCKGHNDCKTADNACGGHASCKGSGFVTLPSDTCAHIDGEKKYDWQDSIAVADLIKCYGVNVCKGHNDCKTASNACSGHATCKGSGWVAAPEKGCKDIGGTVGS